MRTFAHISALATLALVLVGSPAFASEPSPPPSAATVPVKSGMQLYTSDGHRIAPVQYITRQGNPQIILEGRLITVQASTLSQVNGKLTTSLSWHDLLHSH